VKTIIACLSTTDTHITGTVHYKLHHRDNTARLGHGDISSHSQPRRSHHPLSTTHSVIYITHCFSITMSWTLQNPLKIIPLKKLTIYRLWNNDIPYFEKILRLSWKIPLAKNHCLAARQSVFLHWPHLCLPNIYTPSKASTLIGKKNTTEKSLPDEKSQDLHSSPGWSPF